MNIRAQILAEILTPRQMVELERKLKGITEIDLDSFLREYLNKKLNLSKPSYIKRSINPTMSKLVQYFGKEKPVSSISVNDAESFIIKIFSKAQHSARLHHRVCRAIWNWGIRREYLSKNVFTNISLPKHQKGETVTITDEHLNMIIQHIPERIKYIVITLRHTGMRASELLLLKWGDVKIKDNLIVVGSKSFITKSRKIRYIPMNQTLQAIFKNQYNKIPKEEDYVFSKSNGFPYPVDYISKSFKKACRELELPESYHLHCLRATYGSDLINKGIPVYTVSKLLGHSSVKVTEEHYLELSINDIKQALIGIW